MSEDAPGQKKRACLRCGEVFLSSWAGHRLCRRCRKRPPQERLAIKDTLKKLRAYFKRK